MRVQVRVFTDLNNMHIFLEHNKLDILLLGEKLYPLQERDYSNIRIVVLIEDKKTKNELSCQSINKYQSAEHIINDLISICPELKEGEDGGPVVNELEILTLYTLGSEGIGEIFSYLLAKEHTDVANVLFINLEPFNGLRETVTSDNHKGMSDMIYYVNEKVDNLKEKLVLTIKHKDKLDLISNITFSADLYDLTPEGMRILLNTIRDLEQYRYCIINTGFISPAVLELFNQSSKLYIIAGKDEFIYRRKENFVKQLNWGGFEEVLKKMNIVNLSHENKDLILQAYEEGGGDEKIKEYMKSFL